MSSNRKRRSGRHRPNHPQLRPVTDTDRAPSRLQRALDVDSWASTALAERAERLGGVAAYEALSADDVPADEPFDWSSVTAQDHAVVTEVLTALDAFAAAPLLTRRPEFTTILRRLLAVAARQPSDTVRRRTSPPRIAAALAWIAFAGNGELGRGRGRVSGELLWWIFDVGNCAPLARSIAESLGMLEEQPGAPARDRWLVHLGDPGLMRGYRRRYEIELRDEYIERIEAEEAKRAANAVVQITDDSVVLLARDADLVMCVPTCTQDGVPQIAIVLGSDPVEPDEAVAFGLDDAQRLLGSLQVALSTHQRRSS